MSGVLGSETYPVWLDRDLMVKPWLGFPSTSTDTSHDQVLDVIIAGVCTRAAKLRGGPIAPTTYGPDDGLGKFDGDGGLLSGYIVLPRTPVIEVVQVIEWTGQQAVYLPEITDPSGAGAGTPTDPGGSDGYQVNYRTGRLTRVLGGVWNRPFMPGSNNIWVEWVAGYNPIPADWIEAALEWVGFIYRNLQEVVTSNRGVTPMDEYDAATGNDIMYRGVPNRITGVFSENAKVGIR